VIFDMDGVLVLSIGAHAKHILKSDRSFRLNAICRILIGGIGFATPFYVLQATQVLQVPTDTIGLFLAAKQPCRR